MTGIKDGRLGYETWQKEGADRVLQAAGTKHLWEYINKMKATVAEWVYLQQIFEVCAKETGYKGGGRLRKKWWQQTSAEK